MKNPLIAALIGITIGGVGFGLLTPVTVILLEQSGAPSWITGSSTTLGYLAVVLASPFTGRLIDRFGVKFILNSGMIIWLIGSLGHIFWYNYYVLFPIRLITGFGATFIFIATEVIINRCSNENNRGHNIGLYAVLLSIGIAAGTLLIFTVEYGDWVPFVIGSSIMLLALFFMIYFLQVTDEAVFDSIKIIKMKFKEMPFLSLASAGLYGIFESAIIVVLPLYGLRNGFNQIEVSYFLTSFVIGGIVLLYFLSKLSDLYSSAKLLLIISLLLGIFMLIPTLSLSLTFLIIVFFIIGGFVPAYYTIGLNFTVQSIEKKHIAQANSFFIMMYGLGTLIGPIIGSMIVEISKRYGFWIISAALCFSFFLIVLRKYLPNK
ncbi:MAG: MFS transporter [Ignavibacteriae bacterium]|nr:MFS transporter [Ignavibacteriota bacterium]NOG97698.1 MFS transporter [Ignavibacteriota bacterium]